LIIEGFSHFVDFLRGEWAVKNRRRWLIAGMMLLILLMVGYLGGGIFIYNQLTPVQAQCAAPNVQNYRVNSPASFIALFKGSEIDTSAWQMPDYETVTFPARGEPDIAISGWFIPAIDTESPAEQPVVIVVHGLRSCRRDATALIPAGMLAHSGFNVLLIDLRNHGDSTVQDGRTSVGIREYRDVLGAWDWLQAAKEFNPAAIGILGESLGAGTTAIAFGEEPRVQAVWLDSPYADMTEVVRAELARTGYPTFLASSAPLASQLTAGFNIFDKSPLLAMDHAANRAMFITHGKLDQRLSYTYSLDLINRIEASGGAVERWILEDTDHVQALYMHADEYQAKLVAFFTASLANS
jgi:dipeptidyl aminopeptidase/acylaminoacyl peptidase